MKKYHLSTAALLIEAALFFPVATDCHAATVVFNTDNGVMTVDGLPQTEFFGVPVQNQLAMRPEGLVQEFRFLGDMEFVSFDRVSAIGSRPLALIAANDAIIQPGAVLNFSSSGRFGILGGGNGGGTVSGAAAGLGGGGAPTNFSVGAGGAGGTVSGNGSGQSGIAGTAGSQGGFGGNGSFGFAGIAGLPGFANPGSGGNGGAFGVRGTIGFTSAVGAGGGGGAGGAVSGGFGEGGAGVDGGPSGTGARGGNGTAGGAGGAGAGGVNSISGLVLSAGGGGGSGGSGGGGGGGAGGSSGGAGGGGGGGGLGVFALVFAFEDGASGGAGGNGGRGGAGGDGGAGGASGAGGAGGGAVEIAAMGRVTVKGQVSVQGGGAGPRGTPSPFQSGAAAGAGGNGQPGGTSLTGLGGDGGRGGNGGRGGGGGDGGAGGEGGHGGGGAGGTLILRGTIATAAGATVNTAGGASPAVPGGNGRFLIADNGLFLPSFGTTIGATTSDFGGLGGGGINPFIQGGDQATFNVVDLIDGADVYGLKEGINIDSLYFDSVRTQAPAGAVAAVVRRSVGPSEGEQYFGQDLLMLVNLTANPLPNVELGIGSPGSGFRTPLLQQGFARNPLFGGSGPVPLGSLPAGGVYGTLIPNDLQMETNARAGSAVLSGLSLPQLGQLQVVYLTPVPGDYNVDGFVDTADYTVWRDNVGRPIGTLPNDPFVGTTSEPIGLQQRETWLFHYGEGGGNFGPLGIVALPEPQGLGLAMAVLALLKSAPRRRTSSIAGRCSH